MIEERKAIQLAQFNIGDLVLAKYNSGTYIGKVLEDRNNFLLVEVLAVKEHPMQGDLHKRGKVEGVAFFERKALAYREKMNARKRTTQIYDGEVPSYAQSLKEAVEAFREQLEAEKTAFNEKSLEKLAILEKYHYEKIFASLGNDEKKS